MILVFAVAVPSMAWQAHHNSHQKGQENHGVVSSHHNPNRPGPASNSKPSLVPPGSKNASNS
jgi:hypothetical protein